VNPKKAVNRFQRLSTTVGAIYEAQNQLRHKTYRTTEKSYADLITISDYTVEIPKVS
jgi:hypothetical protein